MIIGGLQKVTLVDYPGKIACTVFLSGCNFRCPFCYSKELVLPEEIKSHPQMDQDYFFEFLDGKKGLLEGCVLCGGEPTIYGPELIEFAKKIKEKGFLVKLDTNGTNPDVIKKMIDEKLVDYIAMDIKGQLTQEKYEICSGIKGIDLGKIKESISLIKDSGIGYEFRTTIVPGLHSREDIFQMVEDISPADKYYLQNFRAEKGMIDSKFDNVRPFEDDFVKNIGEEIKNKFRIFKIR